MQRATWTDDRLDGLSQHVDELSQRLDAGFDRVDHRFELVDQRFQFIDQRFDQVDQHLERVDRRLDGLKDGIIDIHKTLNRTGAAIVASLAGVIVATVLSGGGA